MTDNIKMQNLYEGESLSIYRVEDEDGEVGFDITFFDSVTLHLMREEWNELVEIMQQLEAEEEEYEDDEDDEA
ncbi:MAG: hypothetical protein K8I82_01370 [Anaerolineae bacterium]|nr:hypothetical protein [Anaerolineae bacterium]